jgi:hypothetical protein
MLMKNSLPDTLLALWGDRAPLVAEEYSESLKTFHLMATDIAAFCNAAAPIMGATEFDRGVEEGKRRVWLHMARVAGLQHQDFIKISNGEWIK